MSWLCFALKELAGDDIFYGGVKPVLKPGIMFRVYVTTFGIATSAFGSAREYSDYTTDLSTDRIVDSSVTSTVILSENGNVFSENIK